VQVSNNDFIFKDISKLLNTTDPMKIKQKAIENIPEEQLEAEGQTILHKLCVQRMSSLIGKGAFFFGTQKTFITEIMKIPEIKC